MCQLSDRLVDSLAGLDEAIDGEVLIPDSPAFGRLPKPNNSRFDDVSPQAVVLCKAPEDVVQAVAFIRGRGFESATRSGGHDFGGRSSTPGVLIDVSSMSSVSLSNGIATIGAGARLGEVYKRLLSHGVTIPGGTCPSVGIAGLTLGGGLGILGRKYGLTSDNLTGARIVLADGRAADLDEHHKPELFWALRGAGTGHFGVVTEFHFRPVPAPVVVTTFNLLWPFSMAARVVQAWLDWAAGSPDEMLASVDLQATPNPDEEASIELFGSMLANPSDTRDALDVLVGRASDPASTRLDGGSYEQALEFWADPAAAVPEEPQQPSGSRGYEIIKSEFFAQPLPREAVAAILNNLTAARIAGQSRNINFSAWGGAYNRKRVDATAFVHRGPSYWIKHTAELAEQPTADEREAAGSWVNRSWLAARPWGTGGVFPNFADPDLADWGHAYYGSHYERLVQLKARFDSDNLFRFQQSLPIA